MVKPEEALRESERRLLTLMANLPGIAYRCKNDPHWTMEFVSEGCYRLLGYTAAEMVIHKAVHLGDLIHPQDRQRVWEQVQQAIAERRPFQLRYRIRSADGEEKWVWEQGVGVFTENGKLEALEGFITDITQQWQIEEHLKSLNDSLEQQIGERTAEAQWRANQLQRLAAQMTQAEERERRRLSQILHDHLQQVLVAARLRLSRMAAQEKTVSGAIRETLSLLDEAIKESRSLTKELSPPVLYDGGLAAGLEWLGREVEKKFQMPVAIEVAPEMEPDDLTTKVFVFQAARELILNAIKHAHASSLTILLSQVDDERLQVTVEDDGTGFNVESANKWRADGGFGLFSIRERLDVIGGHLSITSTPLEGTKATIIAPCRRSQDSARIAVDVGEHPVLPQAAGTPFTNRIRLVLADDHPVLRKGLADMLAEHPDLEVVGQAGDGLEAIELALRLQPDIVLMDITMPRMDGIEATRKIKERRPDICVIGLSMHETEEMASAMRHAGASEYLTKTAPMEEMVSAILRACPRR